MITQVTGNGRLLLTVNENGDWNELFYPFPGQFQHLREARLGVFDVSGSKFTWLRRGNGFEIHQMPYGTGHLPQSIWKGHGLTISVRDHVHPNHDLVARVFRVRAESSRPVRLFAYHAFQIAESMYQDTAFVDPSIPSLVHYKRGYFFEFFADPPYTRAVCGEHTLKGLQGTYVDAEDGRLEGRSVAHGAADSVMEWDFDAKPDHDVEIRLFLAAGRSLPAVHQVRDYVRHGGSARFIQESEAFWETWVQRRLPHPPQALSAWARDVYRSSVLLLRHSTGPNGAIIASPDTRSLVAAGDTYNYCWWRDGGTSRRRWTRRASTRTRPASSTSPPNARTRTARSSIAITPTGRSGARGTPRHSFRSTRPRRSSPRRGTISNAALTRTSSSTYGHSSRGRRTSS